MQVAQTREYVRSEGLYGPVSADRFGGRRLPYVDNLVNLLVAEDLGDVSIEEVMRVLAPLGVAWVGGERIVKPWPAGGSFFRTREPFLRWMQRTARSFGRRSAW